MSKWIVWNHDLSGGEAYCVEANDAGDAALQALDNMNRSVIRVGENTMKVLGLPEDFCERT